MEIGRIAGATHNLGAPAEWNEEASGRCASLPVRAFAYSDGTLAMTSAWFPTPEEQQRLAHGAPIYLTVVGGSHPPVAMQVGEVP